MTEERKNNLTKLVDDLKFELKTVWKQFLYGFLMFFLNMCLVLFERLPQAIGELISGKVIIPVVFFFLASKIQFEGVDGTINMIMQISTFATTTAGAMIYKFKKDTSKVMEGK